MKRSLLLLLSYAAFLFSNAQKQKGVAYAITSLEKGASKWTEVRLVNLSTGEELKTVYQSASEAQVLNARTGKPIAKTEGDNRKTASYQPFATNSAACAYDKKNNRLYYTPMSIAQLRYIDLKAKTPKVYYFEDEAFGVVKGPGDVASQITRMVIAADGNGYALTNDGKHLIRFTTKKKPEITDLGSLTDDLTNGRHSIHNYGNFGGDMIADKKGNLYLITANNSVFLLNISSMLASYVGKIKGLPKGYSTNGAIAEGNSMVIVSSSRSTQGYYRFDLNTLRSEKISGTATVFNASDLANSSFAFAQNEEEKPRDAVAIAGPETPKKDAVVRNAISVYPNPVTSGFFKISFADQLPGRYNVQLVDAAGKVVSARNYNLVNKVQVEEFRLPGQLAAGNYLVRVVNEKNNAPIVHQVAIQQ